MVHMEQVQLLDQGTYTCECRNAAGSSSKEHHLEVHGEHGPPEACRGGWRWCDFSQCEVQLDSKSIARCLGYLEGMLLPGSALPGSCCTSPPPRVPLPSALSRLQGSSSAPRRVSVIEGGETVLECEAMGTPPPPPRVTWVKDGQPVAAGDGLLLTEQGRRLHIPRAEVAHAGRYTCLAANAEGQEQREFDVVVHGKDVGWSWWLGVRWMQEG